MLRERGGARWRAVEREIAGRGDNDRHHPEQWSIDQRSAVDEPRHDNTDIETFVDEIDWPVQQRQAEFHVGKPSRKALRSGVSPSKENDADATSLSVPEGSVELLVIDASTSSTCSSTALQPSA